MAADRQRLLFDPPGEDAPRDPLDIEDGALALIGDFLARDEADALLETLGDGIDWRQEHISMYGRAVKVPRLTAWYGDAGHDYAYSGIRMDPRPWTPALARIRARVEAACETPFNSVLLNLYRDGSDSVAWHADDEPELGPAPVIASVSLGAVRTFQMRHKTRKDLPRLDLALPHGSLLVMRAPTQAHWLHQVPKRKRPLGVRINLTFRRIVPLTA